MWARTLWPFVNSTRNIALGRASTTAPSISMTPSFLAITSSSLKVVCWSCVDGGVIPVTRERHAETAIRHQGSILGYSAAFRQTDVRLGALGWFNKLNPLTG